MRSASSSMITYLAPPYSQGPTGRAYPSQRGWSPPGKACSAGEGVLARAFPVSHPLCAVDLRTDSRGGTVMTQAQQALAAIQAYMARQPIEDVRAHRGHVWEAVLQGAEGYNAA